MFVRAFRPLSGLAVILSFGLVGPGAACAAGCAVLAGGWPYGQASVVTATGDFAFLTHGRVLTVWDVRGPLVPVALGEYEAPYVLGEIAVAGGVAYLPVLEDLLFAVDVSDPLRPRVLSTLAIPDAPTHVAVEGTYAYVATTAYLKVVDIADPRAMAIVSSTLLPPASGGLAAAGGYVYAARGSAGLRPDGRFDRIAAAAADGSVGVRLPPPPSGIVFYRVAARFGADCIGPR